MTSKILFALAAATVLHAASVAPAAACAVAHEQNVVRGHFAAVVIAIVETAADAGPARSSGPDRPAEWRPWQANARLSRVVSGRADAQAYQFGRTGPFHPCAMAEPMPRPIAGQRWVLYLGRTDDGTLAVAASYPLDVARRLDRRLRQ
ncbi:hypothetical protein BN1110_06470 [bacterium YEK0313]|nr:hypothetical protein BN1110_06470 [bacterium YEK0313]